MTDVLTMNSSIFGTTFKKGRISRRARIAMAKPLEIPAEAHEMTYEDCENTDGGNYFVGVSLSAAETTGFYNCVMSKLNGSGLTATSLAGYAFACFKSTPMFHSLTASLQMIPGIGWAALGVIALSGIALAITVMNKGASGEGFRLGVDVKTWCGIPVGLSFVCQ